ncbi:unnamed protein product [Allacma fusca]|uniref:Cytochrome P450 n=1 Tax=Allacma fusca TaxID=39272 RepID=A0A8J2PQM8_9HEXA|nr:unnamed protein product [Allacma fusca]
MVIFWSLVVLVSIAAFLYHSTRAKSEDNLPPAIQSIPIIGGFIWLFHKKLEDLILKMGKKYGPITRINIGFHELVMINGSSTMKEAGRSASLTGVAEAIFVKCLKDKGMTTPDDGKEHRKFYLKNLKQFDSGRNSTEENIQVEVAQFLDRIKSHGSRVFDVKRSFNVHTINTIFSLLFGVRMEQEDREFQEFLKMIQTYMDASNPFMWICFVLPHLADWIPPSLSGKNFIKESASKFVVLVERSMGFYLESCVPNQPRNYTDALMDKIEVTTDESSVFHPSHKTWVPFITDGEPIFIQFTTSMFNNCRVVTSAASSILGSYS